MPIKPLSHLRPLIRLPTHQTHQTAPDHFTSNPSLLHHLPGNSSTGLSINGSYAAQNGAGGSAGAASSGGSGRAGWGNSGAGSGGQGYTGHARAFLSLPHTGIVDPSSSFVYSSSDERQRISSQRSALLLKHRLSRRVEVIQLEENVARSIHRKQIEDRTGARVGVVQLDDVPARREESRLLSEMEDSGEWSTGENIASSSTSSSRAPQPTIAFPSHPPPTPRPRHSPLPSISDPSPSHSRSVTPSRSRLLERTPTHSRSSTPSRTPLIDSSSYSRSSTPTQTPSHSRRSSLHRSRSSVDLWQVGIPRQLSLRALSTVSDQPESEDVSVAALGLQDVEDLDDVVEMSSRRTSLSPNPRILPQPNRILMDLAGADLRRHTAASSSTPLTRRRYSTAAIEQTEELVAEEDEGMEAVEDAAESSEEVTRRRRHTGPKFIDTLQAATDARDTSKVQRLVDDFRSSQVDGAAPSTELSLAGARYNSSEYTACMQALFDTRRPGQSISTIVALYNEMLERNNHPTNKTYNVIIKAFAQREADVWTAVKQWEETKAWSRWWSEKTGSVLVESKEEQKQDLTMESYKAEGNFANVHKLYHTLQLLPAMRSGSRTMITTDLAILRAIKARGQVSESELKLAQDMYHNHATTVGPYHFERQALYLEVLGLAGRLDLVQEELDRFRQDEERFYDVESLHSKKQNQSYRSSTWTRGAAVLARLGSTDAAYKIFEQMWEISDSRDQIVPTLKGGHVGELMLAFIQAGRTDLAVKINDAIRARVPMTLVIPSPVEDPLLPMAYYPVIDELVVRGDWRTAFSLIRPLFDIPSDVVVALKQSQTLKWAFIESLRRLRLYASILAEALQETDMEKIRELDDTMSLITNSHNSNNSIPVTPELMLPHLKLLIDNEQWTFIIRAMKNFNRSNRSPFLPDREGDNAEFVGGLRQLVSSVVHNDKVPFLTAVEIQRIAGGYGNVRDEKMTAVIASRYLDTRRKAESVEAYEMKSRTYVELLRQLLLSSQDDAELDETWLQISDDLAFVFREESTVDRQTILDRRHERALADRLLFRFGDERGTELLEGIFGQEHAKLLATQWQTLVQPPQLDSTQSAAEVEAASPYHLQQPEGVPETWRAGTFAMPDPPQFVSVIPPILPNLYQRADTIGIKANFGSELEASGTNIHRNPERAFKVIQDVLFRQHKIPSYALLANVIESLGRKFGEGARATEHELHARQLYALGQISLSLSRMKRNDWTNLENAMLVALCHFGYLEEAGSHRGRMIQSGVVPGANAYATMIACSKDTTDDAVVARQLWEESKVLGVHPNLYLFNTIISKLSKARKAEMALELFKSMKEMGITPSSVTYGAVINACCRVGDGQSAATLFDEMASARNFKPRVPPFNTMMQFHLTTEPNRNAVLHYYNALVSSGVRPSTHTYKLLLDAYAVLAPLDIDAVERVFAEIVADPQEPVQATHWASVISAYGIYASDVPKALQISESIPTHPSAAVDITSEPVVWESILNVLAQKSTVESLEAMHTRMLQSGAKTTAYVCNVLISGYAQGNRIDLARQVFDNMADASSGFAAPNNHPTLLTSSGHVKPTTVTDQPTPMVFREPSTYEAMIRAELVAGTRENAEVVLSKMEERRYPVAVYMRVRSQLPDEPIQEQETAEASESQEEPTLAFRQDWPEPERETVNLNYQSPTIRKSELPTSEPSHEGSSVTSETLDGSSAVTSSFETENEAMSEEKKEELKQ